MTQSYLKFDKMVKESPAKKDSDTIEAVQPSQTLLGNQDELVDL
jgi:hypothetical protein